MAKSQPATPPAPPAWIDPFLTALAQVGLMTKACEIAGVDRVSVWRRRKLDPDFAAAIDDAIDMATDRVEAEAIRRAVDGIEEAVWHNGVAVGKKIVYSDSLMTLLLKGRRKKVFADRLEQTGAGGGPIAHQITIVTGVPAEIPDVDDLV